MTPTYNLLSFGCVNYLEQQPYHLEHSQSLKQVPKNFMKTFNVEDVTPTSHRMTSYRKINITGEKIINYRVTSPSSHSQINIIVLKRPGISVIIHFSFSLSVTVRYLNYLNRCIVMRVFWHDYINLSISQKVNEALFSQHLHV